MTHIPWWGLVIAALCVLVAGYFVGWRAGHLTGVKYMLDWETRLNTAEADDLIAQFTWDVAQQMQANGKSKKSVYAEFMQQHNEHYGNKH